MKIINKSILDEISKPSKGKSYLLCNKWIVQLKKFLLTNDKKDFPGEIDNKMLIETTKCMMDYNEPSNIFNYLLKESHEWVKVNEIVWNKLKTIFKK